MGSGRVVLAWRNVGRAILLAFFFLDQFDKRLHDGRLVRIIFLSLRAESISRRLISKFGALICSRCTSLGHLNTPLSSVCTQLAHVCSTEDRSPAKLLPRVPGLSTSLLSGCTSLTASLIKGNPVSTETLALGKEAFAGVPLDNEFLMLVSKLVPQCMKLPVVGTMNNMTESAFISWLPSN